MVVGDNAFQMMFSQMLVAMNNEIPEPKPYPFCNNSSYFKEKCKKIYFFFLLFNTYILFTKMMTMTPAKNNWTMIKKALPAPRTLISP